METRDMASSVRDNTERHRFELEADGHVAFSNYSRAGNVLTILHTDVPKALEGRGIGSTLTRGVLDTARSQGLKVKAPVRQGLHRTAPRIRRLATVIPGPGSFAAENGHFPAST
jgi:uncharacterized protein